MRSFGTQHLVLSLLVCAALVLNWLPQPEEAASTYLAEAIGDNLVIYATARTLNGLISVIQSIELSMSLGAGVAVQFGEMLDPLNDLIERFSGFVLYALAGLGLQQMVFAASSSLFSKVLITLVLVIGYVAWLVRPGDFQWLKKMVLILLLCRFFISVEVAVVATLDKLYFDEQSQHAHSALQLAEDKLKSLRQQYMKSTGDTGLLSGVWRVAESIFGDEDQQGITDLAASAIVKLIVIMLVRSILMPLLFIWLLILGVKYIATNNSRPVVNAYPDPSR